MLCDRQLQPLAERLFVINEASPLLIGAGRAFVLAAVEVMLTDQRLDLPPLQSGRITLWVPRWPGVNITTTNPHSGNQDL